MGSPRSSAVLALPTAHAVLRTERHNVGDWSTIRVEAPGNRDLSGVAWFSLKLTDIDRGVWSAPENVYYWWKIPDVRPCLESWGGKRFSDCSWRAGGADPAPAIMDTSAMFLAAVLWTLDEELGSHRYTVVIFVDF